MYAVRDPEKNIKYHVETRCCQRMCLSKADLYKYVQRTSVLKPFTHGFGYIRGVNIVER